MKLYFTTAHGDASWHVLVSQTKPTDWDTQSKTYRNLGAGPGYSTVAPVQHDVWYRTMAEGITGLKMPKQGSRVILEVELELVRHRRLR